MEELPPILFPPPEPKEEHSYQLSDYLLVIGLCLMVCTVLGFGIWLFSNPGF
jgi:hypothetical protein